MDDSFKLATQMTIFNSTLIPKIWDTKNIGTVLTAFNITIPQRHSLDNAALTGC